MALFPQALPVAAAAPKPLFNVPQPVAAPRPVVAAPVASVASTSPISNLQKLAGQPAQPLGTSTGGGMKNPTTGQPFIFNNGQTMTREQWTQMQPMVNYGGKPPTYEEYVASRNGGGTASTQATTQSTAAQTVQGGGIPLSAEPLHQWEQTALSRTANPGMLGGGGMEQGQQLLKDFAANPQEFISRFTNPMASQYLQQAGTAFTGANAPVTGEEIKARMNPFQQEVIDTSLAQQSQAAQKAKAALLKNLGTRGAAGFGSTISGTQLGEMEAGNVRDAASLGAGLRYQGFNDALGQVNTERNRGVQVGSGFGNLGTQAQNVTASAAGLGTGTAGSLFDTGNVMTNQGYNTLDRMLGAGKYVRDYNQGLATAAEQEMMDAQNFPMTQAQNVLNLLQGVRSGATQATPATYTPSRTGAVLSALPEVFNWLSGVGGNSTPVPAKAVASRTSPIGQPTLRYEY